jgi:hypothetical protein
MRSNNTEASLIKKLDEATETLMSLLATMNERDKYSELGELETKAHLQTVDKKLELLRLKQETLELTFDSLVVDVNEWVNQLQKNKFALGKRDATKDRKEVLRTWLEPTLEKFGQASSDLQAALDGAKEALSFDWNHQ